MPDSSPSSASVIVRVQGSTSNCGAGFDSLGLALRVHNRVTVTRRAAPAAEIVPATPANAAGLAMVQEAADLFFRTTGETSWGFHYGITGEVPVSRGLGSSVTVLAGIIAGLNALSDGPLGREDVVRLVTTLEGHPDNAAASVLGGFCVARSAAEGGRYVGTVRIPVPEEIRLVVASPDVEISTKASRGVLPATVPFFDAVRSVNAAVYLTAILATGEWSKLAEAGGDWLHEPHRLPGIPGAAAAIQAGVQAGAWTGWLSGSGSSVLVVASREKAAAAGEAMRTAFAGAGVKATVRDLAADNDGLVVESA